MAAEEDRDRGIHGACGEGSEPWVGDAVREEQVRGEPILGCRPGRLVCAEPVGEEDAGVDDDGVGEVRDDATECLGPLAVQEHPEGRARRALRSWRALQVGRLRERARRPEAALFHEGPDAACRATLQPPERGRGGAAGDEELGPSVDEDRGDGIEAVAGTVERGIGGEGTKLARAAWRQGEERDVERAVEVEREAEVRPEVRHRHSGHLVEPAREGVVAREVGERREEVGPAERDDVGRVVAIREGARLPGRRDRDEPAEVPGGRERDRACPEHHHPGRTAAGHLGREPPEPRAERCIVGRARDDPDLRGASGEEPAAVPGRDGQPSIRKQPFERAGRRAGFAVEDEDDDPRHSASLASRRRPSVRHVRAYVGLGANLGAAEATLAAGVRALAALPGVRLRSVSRLYATVPVGVTDQPEFRNAVVALDVPAGPDPATGAAALLVALKTIERAFGRREGGRWGPRWGPRELDLDLLVFGRHRLLVERPPDGRSADPLRPGVQWLEVPHASAQERLFVLAPLADLAPRLVPPGWPETVETARRRRERVEGPAAVRPVGQWDATSGAWRPDPT